MAETSVAPDDLLGFWFGDGMDRRWFRSTEALDAEIRTRFEGCWELAAAGRLDHWARSPEGALALVILLDQLPLNMFRNQPMAFSTESKAIEVCRYAIDRGFDIEMPPGQRAFLYMPLMHSEVLADQERSVTLFEAAGLEDNLRFARHHRDLIRRFGRFPHRNALLGRPSTPDELDYLASDGAFTG